MVQGGLNRWFRKIVPVCKKIKSYLLTAIFTTDAVVIQKGYDYLKGFPAPAATMFGIVLNIIFY